MDYHLYLNLMILLNSLNYCYLILYWSSSSSCIQFLSKIIEFIIILVNNLINLTDDDVNNEEAINTLLNLNINTNDTDGCYF